MKEEKLKNIAGITTGIVLKRFEKDKMLSDSLTDQDTTKREKYYHITMNSVQDNKINIGQLESIETKKNVNERYLLQNGDIIMKLAPPYSAALVDFTDKKIVATSNFAIIRKIEHFDPQYLSFILNSKEIRKQIQKYVEGTALPIIKISYLKELKIPYINRKRQELYGKLFSTLYKRIELKKEALELEMKINEDFLAKVKG